MLFNVIHEQCKTLSSYLIDKARRTHWFWCIFSGIQMDKRLTLASFACMFRKAGNDAGTQAIISDGKSHGKNWLVGRRGKKCGSTALATPEPAPTEQYVQELMEKIKMISRVN